MSFAGRRGAVAQCGRPYHWHSWHRRIREVKFRLITRRCHILGVMEERRAKSCDRRRAALELARLMVVHEIEGHPLGLDRGLEHRCFRRQSQTQLENHPRPTHIMVHLERLHPRADGRLQLAAEQVSRTSDSSRRSIGLNVRSCPFGEVTPACLWPKWKCARRDSASPFTAGGHRYVAYRLPRGRGRPGRVAVSFQTDRLAPL